MHEIVIVSARPAHIKPIAANVGAWDRVEAESLGLAPRSAIRLSLIASTHSWTAIVDGRPAAIWGVAPISVMTSEGRPWLICTDEARRHVRAFLTTAKMIVADMLVLYQRLSNMVAAGNTAAIRLLRRLGFLIGSDPLVIGGQPFLSFHRER